MPGNTSIPSTALDVGAVPTSRTVNGKALSSNISINAADVGARADNWVPAWGDVTGKPVTFAPIIGSGASDAMAGNTVIPSTAGDVGAVPVARTVNGKALSSNISLNAADVGALTQAGGDGRYSRLSGGADANFTASPQVGGKTMFSGLKGIAVVASLPGSPDPDILYFVES